VDDGKEPREKREEQEQGNQSKCGPDEVRRIPLPCRF
jgi:hypothetical protein